MNYYQRIIIKFGGGTYVKKLRKIGIGFLVLPLAVGASILGQLYMNTFAVNTLPGDNEVITIGGTTDGQPVNAAISPVGYSGDGNIVLFHSNATNLPDAGGPTGLYTYNIRTGITTRVNLSTNGTIPDAGGFAGAGKSTSISETGRYVIFGSQATNLIDGTTNSPGLLYIRDTQTNTTKKVGGHSSIYSDKWDSYLAVSDDGRFVLMSSRYVANGYPNNYGYALGDNTSGSYTWTSLGTDSYYEYAGVGEMSCDGAYVVFRKNYNIHLADLRNGGSTVIIAGGDNISPIISCNSRYILYATKDRTQITPTPSGMDSYYHLVRYDRITGKRVYIDSNSSDIFSTEHLIYNSTPTNQQPNIFNASIASTGDVVFRYNGSVYLKHLNDGSGTLEPIAKTASGTYVNVSNGEITKDGRYIFFREDPYNLGLASSPSGIQIIRTKTGL